MHEPSKIIGADSYEDKRVVLKLTFADQLSYVKNEGFRTTAISQPFLLLEELKGVNGEMVDVEIKSSNRVLGVLTDWSKIIKKAA